MPYSVILHIEDQDPVLGEIEELPEPSDQFITVNNPRRIDGKDLHYLAIGVVTVIWPVNRLNFVELMPAEDEEEIIGFVRE
jgi:hypothetical protein